MLPAALTPPPPFGRLAKNEIVVQYPAVTFIRSRWANAATLEACREELEEVLEEWILVRVSRNLSLPVINGKDLSIRKAV